MPENAVVENEALIRRLFEAGAHFGFSKSRNHPSAKDSIFTYKNRSAVINLEKTVEQISRAREFISELAKAGKKILLVGTKSEIQAPVAAAALQLGMPHVV